jgi:hypothetical protein
MYPAMDRGKRYPVLIFLAGAEVGYVITKIKNNKSSQVRVRGRRT